VKLEHLCDGEFRYSLLDEIAQSARGDGQVFGQGTGTFTGRLSGAAQWANYPRLSAGYAHPDARGRIELDEGGIVLFELHGLSNLDDGSGIHVITFKTAHEPFLWLNDVIAVGEGSIDVQQQALQMSYYECIVTHRPGVSVASPTGTN
jgi:hypothetical protein